MFSCCFDWCDCVWCGDLLSVSLKYQSATPAGHSRHLQSGVTSGGPSFIQVASSLVWERTVST